MTTHPIICAAGLVEAALEDIADLDPIFMTTPDKATALRAVARLESRLGELKLRLLAHADDVAETTGARDAADWLAHATRTRRDDIRHQQRLAVALAHRYPRLREALRDGVANLAQAAVIVGVLDRLTDDPHDLDPETLSRAEEHLVALCPDHDPRTLALLARHLLVVVAPEIAEAAEARRLADLEANAARRTRLTLRRNGDGTTRLTGTLPDATATRLALALEAFANPRTHGPRADREQHPPGNPFTKLPYPRRLGEAFCQLVETLDPLRLPVHGGEATTLVVTVDLDTLRKQYDAQPGADLATGDIVNRPHVPDATGEANGAYAPTVEHLSAHQLRRLALHRRDHPRRPRRRQRGPRPRPHPQTLHRHPTQGTPPARPHLPSPGMRHPRHLGRSPPLDALEPRRHHRPHQRRPPLLTPSPHRARPRPHRRPDAQRRRQIQPPDMRGHR